MAQDEAPKIQVDDDWKAEAQKEKQRLAEQAAKAKASGTAGAGGAADPASGAGGLPKADFQTLLSTMVTQALFAMGAIPDPQTGQRIAHLDLARHHIDMLGVLEEKTKGNLSEDESNMLSTTLYELRNQYVQIAQAARDQALQQGAPGSKQGPAPPPHA